MKDELKVYASNIYYVCTSYDIASSYKVTTYAQTDFKSYNTDGRYYNSLLNLQRGSLIEKIRIKLLYDTNGLRDRDELA